jgi:hypothetical protein
VAPGEVSITDEHYGSARPDRPRRAPRARTDAEKQFLALGDAATAFLTGAAGAGVATLTREISQILTFRAAHGDAAPAPRPVGQALVLTLPQVPVRPLSDYAISPGTSGGGDQ